VDADEAVPGKVSEKNEMNSKTNHPSRWAPICSGEGRCIGESEGLVSLRVTWGGLSGVVQRRGLEGKGPRRSEVVPDKIRNGDDASRATRSPPIASGTAKEPTVSRGKVK
jgi:hypothetical protein